MSALIEAYQNACGSMFRGFQIFATRNHRVIIDHAEGLAAPGIPMTTETPCYWTSCTKGVTSVALGQLWERGHFSINDRLEDLIKEVSFRSPEIGTLTLRDALTYAIPTELWQDPVYDSGVPDREVIKAIGEMVPAGERDPRKYTTYGAWPWILAGLLIERLSGLSLPAYVHENIFSPLQMTNSSLGIPAVPAASSGDTPEASRLKCGGKVTALMAAGAGWGPMRDLSRLYLCLLNGGELNDCRIIGEPAATALTTRLRAGFPFINNEYIDYGFGFEIESNWYPARARRSFSSVTSERAFGHRGWASAVIFADPEHMLTCAIFANADRNSENANNYNEFFPAAIDGWYAELQLPTRS